VSLALEGNITFQQFDIVIDACMSRFIPGNGTDSLKGKEQKFYTYAVLPFTVIVMSRCSARYLESSSDSTELAMSTKRACSSQFRLNEITFGYSPQPPSARPEGSNKDSSFQLRSLAGTDDRAIKLQVGKVCAGM